MDLSVNKEAFVVWDDVVLRFNNSGGGLFGCWHTQRRKTTIANSSTPSSFLLVLIMFNVPSPRMCQPRQNIKVMTDYLCVLFAHFCLHPPAKCKNSWPTLNCFLPYLWWWKLSHLFLTLLFWDERSHSFLWFWPPSDYYIVMLIMLLLSQGCNNTKERICLT